MSIVNSKTVLEKLEHEEMHIFHSVGLENDTALGLYLGYHNDRRALKAPFLLDGVVQRCESQVERGNLNPRSFNTLLKKEQQSPGSIVNVPTLGRA